MPFRKLCIVAYRKGQNDERIIEMKSLRRLMQLYGLMMYGPPIQIERDLSQQSNDLGKNTIVRTSTKGPLYQCPLCNMSNQKSNNIERHMDTHVLVLIQPENSSGYMCYQLKSEIQKMKMVKSGHYVCMHCRKTFHSTKLV